MIETKDELKEALQIRQERDQLAILSAVSGLPENTLKDYASGKSEITEMHFIILKALANG